MILRLIFVLFISVFTGNNGVGQERSRLFDSLFTGLYTAGKFTGNVLIAENGKPVFKKSYGKAFREQNLDLNNETVFELASVSKQFTAMGIMLLEHQGKLSYTDSLRKFFPELPYHGITLRHLLQHTSGLPDYMNFTRLAWFSRKILRNADIIRIMAEQKPKSHFAPGEKWEYSNTGYALLGSIIEQVSGTSYNDFLRLHIFQPLGMTRTRVYQKRWEKTTISNYAYGYVREGVGHLVMADSLRGVAEMVYALDGIFGDGVVNSSTGDLLKWDQALYTEKLIPRAKLMEGFKDAVLNNGKTFAYGFGWSLINSDEYGRYMNHSGGWPGYSTWIERHPEKNKTIILLANSGAANDQLRNIRKILYGKEIRSLVPVKPDKELMSAYEGVYRFDNGDSVRITVVGDSLSAESATIRKHFLFPEKTDVFFRKERDDIRFHFLRNGAGQVDRLEVKTEGHMAMAVKIEPGKIIDVHLHGSGNPAGQMNALMENGVTLVAISTSWKDQDQYRNNNKLKVLTGLMFPCPMGKVPYSGQHCFQDGKEWPEVKWVEQQIKEGRIDFIGEVLTQYYGISSSNPKMYPYYALAEKYKLPVGIHTGSAGPDHGSPYFKEEMGSPVLLTRALQKFPGMKVWLMHGGAPFVKETIAMMKRFPQLYMDISVLNNPSIIPPKDFSTIMQSFIEAGLEDRLMFGTDNADPPVTISAVKNLTFLTNLQKEKIFYRNALHFFQVKKPGQ